MNKYKSIITQKGIETFYKHKCKELGNKFTDKKVELFVIFCERDFYDWLNSNFRYFEPSEN